MRISPNIHGQAMQNSGLIGRLPEKRNGRHMRDHIVLRAIQLLLITVSIIFLFPVSAKGQASVTLSPVARQQFFSASGTPLAGGLVYTYISGTTTPQVTYTDSTGTVPNTNPVVLDSGGFASIWLVTGDVYTIAVTDASNSPQWTVNGVNGGQSLLSPGPIGTTTPNVVEATEFLTGSPLPALTGLVRLASSDQLCWRNNAGTGDICLSKNTSDALLFNSNPFAFLNQAQTFTATQTFSGLQWNSGGSFLGVLAHSNTATRTYTFPDITGTVCLTTQCQHATFFDASFTGLTQIGTGGATQFSLGGALTQYLGQATASNGMTIEVGNQNPSCTATCGPTTLFTSGASGVVGRVVYYFVTSTAGSAGTATLTINWNDEATGVAETVTSSTLSLTSRGAIIQGSAIVEIASAQSVTFTLTFSGPGGSPTVDGNVTMESF